MGAISTFGPFVFDREQMTLTREGRVFSLGSRGAALLSALVKASGDVVSKESLLQAAWPRSVVNEANLTVQVAALRRAMANGPGDHEWIVTVPRVGYRLSTSHKATDAGTPAVAVLPFESLSADPEQNFLADGIVDEIITALSRFRTFAVVARSSTFAYKGRAIDVREVAHDLGVSYVLEGSVRRSGDRVRVTAQLIEGTSGAHLWTEKFEGAVDDIFDFQDQITTSVIGLIEPRIRQAEIKRARRKHPESLGAWDLYVQAVPLVYSAYVPGYSKAINLLDRALAIEPTYVPALAFASWAHERRKTFGGKAPANVDDVESCLALAQRALDADPDDALAMGLLGWERIRFHRDYAGLDLCTRAAGLNPNNRAVLDLAAVAHIYAGDLSRALAYGTRALQLSPGALDAYACMTHLSSALIFAGRFDEAAEWARRSLGLEKKFVFSHMHLAIAEAHLGNIHAAKATMKTALALRPDLRIACQEEEPIRFPDRKKTWIVGCRLAGMPEG